MHTGNILQIGFLPILTPVYPCAYREHAPPIKPAPINIGLSLCIQGTLKNKSNEEYEERFIPVHTGNIKTTLILYGWETVYPCAYREHEPILVTGRGTAGLSLCIQGTLK